MLKLGARGEPVLTDGAFSLNTPEAMTFSSGIGYMHNWMMPFYCLYLDILTS